MFPDLVPGCPDIDARVSKRRVDGIVLLEFAYLLELGIVIGIRANSWLPKGAYPYRHLLPHIPINAGDIEVSRQVHLLAGATP